VPTKKLGKLTPQAPEDRRFRSCFGIPAEVFIVVWDRMRALKLIPVGGVLNHYFWALIFMNLYPENENELCTLCGGIDPKTFRKWAWPFIEAMHELSYTVVNKSAKLFDYYFLIIHLT